MKKVVIMLLVLVWCHSAFAQKVTFRLQAGATYPVIPDVQEEAMFETFMPPIEGQERVPQQERGIITTKINQKAGGRLGGTLGIEVSDKLTLETGLQATLVRYQMNKQTEFTYNASSNAILRRWRDDSKSEARTTAFSNYQNSKAGNTSVLYIALPLAARYNVHRFIDLRAGISASILAYSERYGYQPYAAGLYYPTQGSSDPYDPYWTSTSTAGSYGYDTSGGSFNKLLMSLNTGITLKATKHIGFDLDYARFLTPIYKSQAEKHPHKYNLFSAGMSYAF